MMIKWPTNVYELAQTIALLKLKNDPAQRWKYVAIKEDLEAKRQDSHILEDFIKTVVEMAEKMEAGISPNAFMTPVMRKEYAKSLVNADIQPVVEPVELTNPS
jgi:hypothetical protein